MKQVLYMLTCVDEAEAKKIAEALVDNRYAACVKMMPVQSTFRWEGGVQHTPEVLLLIESTDEAFESINATVKKLHSYDQYVLNQVDIPRSNDGVYEWIKEDVR